MIELTKEEIKEFLLTYFSDSTTYYWINGEAIQGPYDPENMLNGKFADVRTQDVGKFLLEKLCRDSTHTDKYMLGYWEIRKDKKPTNYIYTGWSYCSQEQQESEEAKRFTTSLMLLGL